MYAGRHGLFISPEQVSIELTTACNYSCIHCATTIPGYRGQTMTRTVAFDIIDQISQFNPEPERVRLFGQGEVCVLPWLPDYLTHIRKRLPHTQILISTNGSKLRQLAQNFVDNRVTHLYLSLEGGSRAVHDNIRGEGSFDEVMAGLETLERAKEASNGARPTFEFTAVLTSETVFDLKNLVELGHRVGATAVKTQALIPHKELNLARLRLKTLDDVAVDRARACIEESQQLAVSYGLEFRHLNAGDPFNEPEPDWNDIQTPEDVAKQPEPAPGRAATAYRDCLEPWKELWINVGLGLNTCERRRFDVRVGVESTPIRDLYESPALDKVRQSLLSGTLDPICGGCILRKASAEPPDPVAWGMDRVLREVNRVRAELHRTETKAAETTGRLERARAELQSAQASAGELQTELGLVRSELEAARQRAARPRKLTNLQRPWLTRSFASWAAAALVAAPAGCSRREPDRFDWLLAHRDAGAFSARVDLSQPSTAWQQVVGFYPVTDHAWAWTEPTFAVALGAPSPPPAHPVLRLLGYVPPPEIDKLASITLRATVSGKPLEPQTLTNSGGFTYTRELDPAELTHPLRVEFAVDKPFVPGGADTRPLGLVVNAIWIEER